MVFLGVFPLYLMLELNSRAFFILSVWPRINFLYKEIMCLKQQAWSPLLVAEYFHYHYNGTVKYILSQLEAMNNISIIISSIGKDTKGWLLYQLCACISVIYDYLAPSRCLWFFLEFPKSIFFKLAHQKVAILFRNTPQIVCLIPTLPKECNELTPVL